MNSIFNNYRSPSILSPQPQMLSLTFQIQTIHLVACAALALLAYLAHAAWKRCSAKILPASEFPPGSRSKLSLDCPPKSAMKTPGKTKNHRVSFGGKSKLETKEEILSKEWAQGLDGEFEALTINKCKAIDPTIFEQSSLSQLKTLIFNRSNRALTDTVLAAISKKIEWLELKSGSELTENGFQALSDMKGLIHLNLEGCLGLTDQAVSFLPSCITYLRLTRCHVTGEALKSIPSTIEELDLSDCHMIFSLENLAHIPKRITLAGCNNLTASLPAFLSRADGLESLDVTDCTTLQDAHLACIPSSLKELKLDGCAVLSPAFVRKMEERFSSKYQPTKTPYRKPKT